MNRSFYIQLLPFLKNASLKRGAIFGGILLCALLAFEVFNFGTTSFALQDMFGGLTFAGFKWSTILAIAFCGIDFAGIARIFTPEKGRDEPAEVWYLFGAWLLAAGFNAMLTWWGVSVAVMKHNAEGGSLVGQNTMTNVVPIFVAAMVWLVRVLIIGTFSVAGERLFTLADTRDGAQTYQRSFVQAAPPQPQVQAPPSINYPRPAPKPQPSPSGSYNRPSVNRPEPAYHPVGMTAMSNRDSSSSTRR